MKLSKWSAFRLFVIGYTLLATTAYASMSSQVEAFFNEGKTKNNVSVSSFKNWDSCKDDEANDIKESILVLLKNLGFKTIDQYRPDAFVFDVETGSDGKVLGILFYTWDYESFSVSLRKDGSVILNFAKMKEPLLISEKSDSPPSGQELLDLLATVFPHSYTVGDLAEMYPVVSLKNKEGRGLMIKRNTNNLSFSYADISKIDPTFYNNMNNAEKLGEENFLVLFQNNGLINAVTNYLPGEAFPTTSSLRLNPPSDVIQTSQPSQPSHPGNNSDTEAPWSSKRIWFFSDTYSTLSHLGSNRIISALDDNTQLLMNLASGMGIHLTLPGYFASNSSGYFSLKAQQLDETLFSKMDEAMKEEGTILLVRINQSGSSLGESGYFSVSVGKVKANMDTVKANYNRYNLEDSNIKLGSFLFGMEAVY